MSKYDYKEAECCGADCEFLDCDDDQPCWGQVEVVDEEFSDDYEYSRWIHACQGHEDIYCGGEYIPRPEDEDD